MVTSLCGWIVLRVDMEIGIQGVIHGHVDIVIISIRPMPITAEAVITQRAAIPIP